MSVLQACADGNLSLLKSLKDKGEDFSIEDEYGKNPLLCACWGRGDINTIKWLLDQGFSLDDRTNLGGTSFLLSAERGHLGLLKFFKEINADIRATNKNGENALHRACFGKADIPTIHWMLEQGFSIQEKDSNGRTPFLRSAFCGRLDLLKFFKEINAVLQATNKNGENALHLACTGKADIATIKWLLQQGFSIETPNANGYTAFYFALQKGHKQLVRFFLELKPDLLNKTSESRKSFLPWKRKKYDTPLIFAITKGHTDVVSSLLELGADVNRKDSFGLTAQKWAEIQDDKDIVDLLTNLQKGNRMESGKNVALVGTLPKVSADEPTQEDASEQLEGAIGGISLMNVSTDDKNMTEAAGKQVAPSNYQGKEEMHSLPARHLQVDFSKLELDHSERLGRGRYGEVFRGELRGTPVAVKEIVLPTRTKNLRKSDIKEIEVCASISHPSIALFMAYSFVKRHRENCLFLIFELVNGHNLDQIINYDDLRQHYGFDNLSRKCSILLQASQAVAYLHKFTPPIVHGDIKPSNIMLNTNGKVKVCDFGLSKLKQSSSLSTTAVVGGTPAFLVPEQLLHGKTSSIESDMYAFGATVYEIIFDCLMWDLDDSSNRDFDHLTRLKKKVESERIPTALQKEHRHPCYSLILSCVLFEPHNRADALTIVSALEKLCKSVQ